MYFQPIIYTNVSFLILPPPPALSSPCPLCSSSLILSAPPPQILSVLALHTPIVSICTSRQLMHSCKSAFGLPASFASLASLLSSFVFYLVFHHLSTYDLHNVIRLVREVEGLPFASKSLLISCHLNTIL